MGTKYDCKEPVLTGKTINVHLFAELDADGEALVVEAGVEQPRDLQQGRERLTCFNSP